MASTRHSLGPQTNFNSKLLPIGANPFTKAKQVNDTNSVGNYSAAPMSVKTFSAKSTAAESGRYLDEVLADVI